MEFNFEKALAEWRQQLAKRKGLTPEFRNELESSLHDHYDAQLIRGLTPEQAFAEARQKVTPPTPPTSFPTWLLLLPSSFKVAIRSLKKRATYGIINFVCLALGMLTVTLAALYLDYELQFDKFVPQHKNKYRLARTYRSQDYSVFSFPNYFSTTAPVQLDQLRAIEATPGVASTTQFYITSEPTYVRKADQRYPVQDILETNTPARFTDFFGWKFELGAASGFNDQPFTVILTESMAQQFYGNDWRTDASLGSTLTIDTVDYTLAGVIKDVPANCHFDFTMAIHSPRISYWGCRFYVELDPNVVAASVEKRLDNNIGQINPSLASDELFGGTILQPLASIHLKSDLLYEMKPPGNLRYLYIIGIIALVILLLTIGNYTNLAIAMNFSRQREIGMRKTFGAGRRQIAGQFIFEALLLCILAIPVVGFFLWWILPHFNALMDTGISSARVFTPKLWRYLFAVAALTGCLASIYPAIWLSSRPVLSLFRRVSTATSFGRLSLRKLIVGFQFALLIGLTSLTFFVNRQLKYLQDKDIGYVKEGVLYVSTNADSSTFSNLKTALLDLPNVTGVGADGYMGTTSYNQTTYQLAGQPDIFDDAYQAYMSYDAAQILGFNTSLNNRIENPQAAPQRTILINETLAEKFASRYQFTDEQLIGQSIILEPEYTDEESGEVGIPLIIDGTVQDINMFSLRQRVEPIVMMLTRSQPYVYWTTIGFSGISPSAINDQVKAIFQRQFPQRPFIRDFLQQNLAELYRSEERIARLSIFFSGVAFFVALIGLIGLTAFLTTLRRKEIGVRKILGASNLEILYRFNREYISLVAVALLVAAPLTYYGLQRWLTGFAYRIELQAWVFLLAATITFLITLIAVSLVSLRAANSLPINALRDDQ